MVAKGGGVQLRSVPGNAELKAPFAGVLAFSGRVDILGTRPAPTAAGRSLPTSWRWLVLRWLVAWTVLSLPVGMLLGAMIAWSNRHDEPLPLAPDARAGPGSVTLIQAASEHHAAALRHGEPKRAVHPPCLPPGRVEARDFLHARRGAPPTGRPAP